MWVKTSNTGLEQRYFSYNDSGDDIFVLLRQNPSGYLEILSRIEGASVWSPTATSITANVYHHVLAVWESGISMRLYVDGLPYSSISIDPIVWLGSGLDGRILGAARDGSSHHTLGSIDEVRFYNHALTADDAIILNSEKDGPMNLSLSLSAKNLIY